MSKRLGKDIRAKFLAEFEKEGKIISDPNYYAIKSKTGKVQIRKIKHKEEQTDTGEPNNSEPQKIETPVKQKKEKTL